MTPSLGHEIVAVVLGLGTWVSGFDLAAAQRVDYLREIKPLLANKCVSCHGALAQQAGLRLDTGSFILAGGDDGPVVSTKNASASRLIKRVASDDADVRMPPHGEGAPLDLEQIELLSAWIDAGAPIPDDEPIPADPRDHWAFRPPVRPQIPEREDVEGNNLIDVFILAEQRRSGVRPMGGADRETLLRRAYFDLVGLPPTVEQQQTFLDNESADAWEQLLDELLASPHYGERWARHWMDIWRYSDWDGYKEQLRSSQRHIWRWRDWIVRSLNDDKGYDRMVVEKLTDAEEAAKLCDGEYTPVGTIYPSTSTGRRLALARWITSRDNPLAARVAVNHVWLRHFGAPLVANVDDFGLRSPQPRHADLLDWMAVELIDNNWSLKHLHRLILTSDTWRRSSAADDAHAQFNRQLDPDNRTLWRTNVRRLEAESVRDSILSIAGELDPKLGGPDIPFTDGETTTRRSIYLQHAYEKQMSLLVQFDAASPNECYRRSESIIPQQALALANSTLSAEKSRVLSERIWNEVSDVDLLKTSDTTRQFVDRAFRRILARQPSNEECKACVEFLDQQSTLLTNTAKLNTFVGGTESTKPPAQEPNQRARENFILVLMNHNDFVTVR